MTLAWWQLATLVAIVFVVGKVLLVAYRNGWDHLAQEVAERWWTRPRPVAAWRSQDQWQRRRQALAGLAVACVIAMLLAVALRGLFVAAFLLTLAMSGLSIVFATLRGAFEMRRGPQTVARQLADLGPDTDLQMGPYAETGIFPDRGAQSKIEVGPVEGPPRYVDDETPLMFEPLGIDPVEGGYVPPPDGGVEEPMPKGERLVESRPDQRREDVVEESASENEKKTSGPSFSAAPSAGRHQASARARSRKRSKARPIYIESTLDGENEQGRPDTGRAADGR